MTFGGELKTSTLAANNTIASQRHRAMFGRMVSPVLSLSYRFTHTAVIICMLDTAHAEPLEARGVSPFDKRRANGCVLPGRTRCFCS